MADAIADVCLIGVGAAGGILAKELGTAGLKVVAFERGPTLTLEDYAVRDAIKFIVRHDALDWARHDPVTFRASPSQPATPRFPSVNALGGQTLHWTGVSARFMPGDFKVFTREVGGGVADRANANLTGYKIMDWPIDYDDLEPYYEKFEWKFGVSGNPNGNPFAGPRKRGFPLPGLRRSAKMDVMDAACRELGYHPYEGAAGILSRPYRPPAPYDTRIAPRPACTYCAHCNFYGCHVQAKDAALYTTIPVAQKTGNVELHTLSRVFRINTDAAGKVTGVNYLSPDKQVMEQRARVVILCGYTFENTRLLLMSRAAGGAALANSSGAVGKGVFGHGDVSTYGLFDDYIVNAFIGPDSALTAIDDFNGNNFDHAGLGFIRGGEMFTSGDGTPVQRFDVVPPDGPKWGAAYKEQLARGYTRTLEITVMPETLAHQDNLIDLDPDRKDDWGIPAPRLTFAFHENERKMHAHLAQVMERIVRTTGAKKIWSRLPAGGSRWCGGTRMGSDPKTSVVNGWCQSHDVPNLFVLGASVFPTMTGYPATATVSALAYRTADYIKRQREWFR